MTILEVSDFEVTGPEHLMVGDTVTASFTLKATQIPIQFGKQGAFVRQELRACVPP